MNITSVVVPAPDPAAAASAAGLPLITIALCGNARKHSQSFDSLRVEADTHNATLHRAVAGSGAPFTLDGVGSATIPSTLSGAPIPRVFFRLVNLNYDPARRRMVLCSDSSIKGTMPQREEVGLANGDGSSSGYRSSSRSRSRSSVLAPPGDGEAAEELAATVPPRRRRHCDDAGVCEAAVDAVVHKVASFGTADAAHALHRFLKRAQSARTAMNRRHCHRPGAHAATDVTWPRPPIQLVDSLECVNLLTHRRTLYQLLDNQRSSGGHPTALIPRTYLWERPAGPGATPVMAPVGLSSFVNLDTAEQQQKTRANGPAAEKWWVAKPNEGTGPAFTHHLVLWKSRDAEPQIPAAVQAALPPEASAFVVQEYYVHSLPVVLKVYVVDENIFVKVSPTVKLLAMVESQLAQAEAGAGGSGGFDVPIRMDSQRKDMFTAAGLLTATSAGSYTTSATLTPEASSGTFAAATPAGSSRRCVSNGGRTPDGTPLLRSLSATVATESPWRAVAPTEYWDAFLAPGKPAHTHIVQLAHALSAPGGGLGLTLYGFDIVLLPRHLAHAHQRAACPTGIGGADHGGGPSSSAARPAGDASGIFAHDPSSMFDLETGEPTPLLAGAVPVVIDVNYFPGYKGMASANANMLAAIWDRVAAQSHGCPHWIEWATRPFGPAARAAAAVAAAPAQRRAEEEGAARSRTARCCSGPPLHKE